MLIVRYLQDSAGLVRLGSLAEDGVLTSLG